MAKFKKGDKVTIKGLKDNDIFTINEIITNETLDGINSTYCLQENNLCYGGTVLELATQDPLKSSFKDRLKIETQDLMVKVNKLHDYMRTQPFYELEREHKDLLYEQLHAMLDYLQILGKRCELLEIKLDIE